MEHTILFVTLLLTGLAMLRFFNSRQWLIAWAVMPFAVAGIAWRMWDGTAAIIAYWLTVCAFMFPFHSAAARHMDETTKDITLGEMWRRPFPLWQRIFAKKPPRG